MEKELLFKDLCARLLHGVKILHNGWDFDRDCEFSTVETLIGIDDRFIHTLWRGEKDKHSIQEPSSILDYKPYLRPMSSMTEAEREKVRLFIQVVADENYGDWFSPSAWQSMTEFDDYCCSRHLDHRGLISKGLALEAPEGMYDLK